MPKIIVVADASPVIALSDIDALWILRELYEIIYLTDVVRQEIEASLPTWFTVVDNYDQDTFKTLKENLDAGEASAITYAKEIGDCL
ncbi:MAG: DUF3368 domain-containing protein, partial [Bacteroidota bacterium]